jgi:hypothetical protein
MADLLLKQQREINLLTLSIEIENVDKELREKQEAMDMLQAQKASLLCPADLVSEQGLLESAGECHSVSQPQAAQKTPAMVVTVGPGREQTPPEVHSPSKHLDNVKMDPTMNATSSQSDHRQVALQTASSVLSELQHTVTPVLEAEIDGGPSGRRERPLEEVCYLPHLILQVMVIPMVLILMILILIIVFHTMVSLRNMVRRKMVPQRVGMECWITRVWKRTLLWRI